MDLLRRLFIEALPVTLWDEPDADRAHVLHAAGQIACTFSDPRSREPFARVLAVTKEGVAALAFEELVRRRKGAP